MKALGIGFGLAACAMGSVSGAQGARTASARMAPIARYLMARDSEIALARSAAPRAIANGARILVLTPAGFQIASHGTNGFVCLVARSWSAGFGDPDFWNPRVRAPICYNAAAARSQVPETIARTRVALAGGTEAQIRDTLRAAIARGALPVAQSGSVSYMMARGTYFNRGSGPWLPHLMLYMPETNPASWGAGLPESPMLGNTFPDEHLTVILIPVGRWSDGSRAGGKPFP